MSTSFDFSVDAKSIFIVMVLDRTGCQIPECGRKSQLRDCTAADLCCTSFCNDRISGKRGFEGV